MWNFTNYLVMYDIANPKRATIILSILRRYCYHIQNSVFEGKLTKSQFLKLKGELKESIVEEKDSIIIYPMSYLNILNKEKFGKPRYKRSNIF